MADRPGSEQVRAALAEVVAKNPEDLIARHNLGVELRRLSRPAEGLIEIETAVRGGLVAPETATMRAHLLADLGRFDEAVAQYLAVLERHPEMTDAHEALARLLPQLGRADEALDAYRAALSRQPRSGLLLVSALASAQALSRHEQLLDWAAAARPFFGPDAMLDIFVANALSGLGDHRAARNLLYKASAQLPDYPVVHVALAQVALKLGEWADAAQSAMHAASLSPDDQSAWALLGIAWRMMGDQRESWLCDYEQLIMTLNLDVDMPRLAARVAGQHIMREHPGDQSLRGGTQTRGTLFASPDPEIRRLVQAIVRAVEPVLAALPADPTHPFLRRNSGRIDFAGSWSVRLTSEGHHIGHIHNSGWLSSACYLSLPPEVAAGTAGALAFGRPDPSLGIDVLPRRIVHPAEGRLVVFPSYFWHGTLPFTSTSPRLTVAFDALPVDRPDVRP